jgi:hypothetical protein
VNELTCCTAPPITFVLEFRGGAHWTRDGLVARASAPP